MADSKYFYGLGRRKSATARARLLPGKGNVTINDKPAAEYLDGNKSLLAAVTVLSKSRAKTACTAT